MRTCIAYTQQLQSSKLTRSSVGPIILYMYFTEHVFEAVAYLRGGPLCEPPPLWPDRHDFFKDELSRLRTAKVAQVTEV